MKTPYWLSSKSTLPLNVKRRDLCCSAIWNFSSHLTRLARLVFKPDNVQMRQHMTPTSTTLNQNNTPMLYRLGIAKFTPVLDTAFLRDNPRILRWGEVIN